MAPKALIVKAKPARTSPPPSDQCKQQPEPPKVEPVDAKQLSHWRACEARYEKDLINATKRIKEWEKLAADGDAEYVESLKEKQEEKKEIEARQSALKAKIAAAMGTIDLKTATTEQKYAYYQQLAKQHYADMERSQAAYKQCMDAVTALMPDDDDM